MSWVLSPTYVFGFITHGLTEGERLVAQTADDIGSPMFEFPGTPRLIGRNTFSVHVEICQLNSHLDVGIRASFG